MKVIDVYPKDVHVNFEMPLSELKMLEEYIKKSMPIYNKVMEDYPERSFLESIFLPVASDVLKMTDKFKT